jgi:TolB protein
VSTNWPGVAESLHGAIVRFDGLKRHVLAAPIDLEAAAALAAGGGRVAWAENTLVADDADAPAWSPNGEQIAYNRHSFDNNGFDNSPLSELWIVNADGTNPHRIAERGRDPAWSPDGTKLAYGDPHGQVIIANSDGSDPRVLTAGSEPAWAPDGMHLAVVDRGGIWIVSLDGQQRQLVIAKGAEPDWSPDGTQLVYTVGQGQLMIASADGSGARMLMLGEPDLQAYDPAWSPDGQKIAYVGGCTMGGQGELCEIGPNGGAAHPLISGNDQPNYAYSVAWGPDPGTLVYSAQLTYFDGDSHLAVLSGDGSRQITTGRELDPTIVVATRTGHRVGRIKPGGEVRALAVSDSVVAALVREPGNRWAVEIYQPQQRIVPLNAEPGPTLEASGTTLVFSVGRTIEVLDAARGSPRPITTTRYNPVGLSIIGGRIAWADGNRIRMIQLP